MITVSPKTHTQLEIIATVCEALSRGGLVIFPTETTYGIGVDATNSTAIQKLLEYKQKRDGKPLSIAVCDQEMADQYVDLNQTAKNIYKEFLPGPVTVISKGKHVVASGVESPNGTLGIRIPAYPLILELVKTYQKPITATGANASYQKRPYSVQDIMDNISDKQKSLIDIVIDVGELPHNEPSTVIDTTLDEPTVLRQGEIPFSQSHATTTHDEQETIELGRRLLTQQKNIVGLKPIIFALKGPMGAGKTQLTKGIALGLGIDRTISSPTFILSKEYPFIAEGQQHKLVHIDAWRMTEEDELDQLGFPSFLLANDVVVIEWAEKTMMSIQSHANDAMVIWVELEYGEKENERKVKW